MPWTVAQTAPAKPAPTPQQREAVRQGASLTVAALLVILTIGAFALVLLARHRRTALERRDRKTRVGAHTGAWHESAKRLRIAGDGDDDGGGGGADDDTVDIDPGDLSPDDVDDGDGPTDRDGKGWKP